MKRLITLFALALMIVSGRSYAWSGVAASQTVNEEGETVNSVVYKDPDTGTITTTTTVTHIDNTETVSVAHVQRSTDINDNGAPWHNYSTDPRDWDTDGDGQPDGDSTRADKDEPNEVTIKVVHTQGNQTRVVPFRVIQPNLINAPISIAVAGSISSSASSQAHELEEVVLKDSSWIENETEFWKYRERNKGNQL